MTYWSRIFLSILWLFPLSPYAQDLHDRDDCVNCGAKLPAALSMTREVTDLQKQLICNGFAIGQIENTRRAGVQIFGDIKSYYHHMTQIQCGTYPSPIYILIDAQPVINGYEMIYEDLAQVEPEVLAVLLNRPRYIRARKETIIDLIDKQIERMSLPEAKRHLEDMRRRFVDFGAKKYVDLTPEELAIYD